MQTLGLSSICLFGFLVTCRKNLVIGHSISGELYSSLTHMNDLFVFDSFVGKLLPYVPSFVPEARRYKESYECLTKDVSRMGKGDLLDLAITGNPLHLFSVIKRLVLFWPELRRAIFTLLHSDFNCNDHHESCKFWASWSECQLKPSYMAQKCRLSCGFCARPELREGIKDLPDIEKRTVLPIVNDLRGASLALARLQKIYRIPISQIAEGTIEGVTTCVRLSAYDCIRIANESHHETEYASAYQWYHYAAGMSEDLEMRSYVKTLKEHVAIEHDAKFQAENTKFFPDYLSRSTHQNTMDDKYSKLCRGISFMDAASVSPLKCHVNSRGSPYLILRPVKYEQLHDDPEMYKIYDIISEKEIQIIKQLSKDHLERSLISSLIASELRVSQTTWLANNTHPLLPRIAQRISAIMGLHIYEGANYVAGDLLQVLCYGIGGHYTYHLDAMWKPHGEEVWPTYRAQTYRLFDSGDRMATWMFYLSDVEAGGRTAFPNAGLSIVPEKGNAVFWYNLKRNGDINLQSYHGGCPVLLGHKWVMNKWIREHINFLKRPCSLDPNI